MVMLLLKVTDGAIQTFERRPRSTESPAAPTVMSLGGRASREQR